MKSRVFVLFRLMDWPDRLALLGLALICSSIYQVIGWPGVLGFVGGVCLLLGAFMAGTKPSKGNSRRSENLN